MPWWAEPWRRTVVVVCVCQCVCMSFMRISLQWPEITHVSAKNCNATVMRQYLQSLFCKF